jgi:UDP-2,3-diacylglucosamine hydrolase
MSTLFISDLHLEDSRAEPLEWLMAFLEGPARDAEALYILGDLFEYWIGDDALPACARQLADVTRKLADGGLPLFFMHGNRDFLLGQEYAAMAGFSLLPESVVTDLYGKPTLLLHGDSLCTDDAEYQAFRLQARNPAWQAAVLARSVEERLAMARSARDASTQHTGSVSMEIMDVNDEAVRAAFREHGVSRMIHGHTHRPAMHDYDLGEPGGAQRIVLADWYGAGSYLDVSAAGARSRDI